MLRPETFGMALVHYMQLKFLLLYISKLILLLAIGKDITCHVL